ncbi:hypothetical protein ACFSHQ_11870 [Gemmobacter lanyuensis]
MWTWVKGSAHVKRKSRDSSITLDSLMRMLEKSTPVEVAGTAVFLTADPEITPPALLHNLKHNRVLHKQNFIVTVTVEPVPEVPESDRLQIERLNDRFVKMNLTFGYMDDQNVPKALALARKQGEKFDIMTTSFFLNHRSFRSAPNEGLPRWQEKLFISMARGATNATEFYRLPTNRVLELGQQLTI